MSCAIACEGPYGPPRARSASRISNPCRTSMFDLFGAAMKTDRLLFLFVASVALLPAQDEGVTLGHSDWSGVRLHFAAKFEPADLSAEKRIDGAVVTGQGSQHRLILDRAKKR